MVDQFVWSFGKASVEAMALGIPVIIRRDEQLNGQRGNAPVFVVATKDELKCSSLIFNKIMLLKLHVSNRMLILSVFFMLSIEKVSLYVLCHCLCS